MPPARIPVGERSLAKDTRCPRAIEQTRNIRLLAVRVNRQGKEALSQFEFGFIAGSGVCLEWVPQLIP